MAESHEKPVGVPDTATGDRDVDTRSLYRFMAGLFAMIVVSAAVVWGLSVVFRKDLVSSDPPPSPLAEANAKHEPPGPRLEVNPPRDLAELRAREEAILNGWGWVDKENGVAQIPVVRAAEIIAEKGLPKATSEENPSSLANRAKGGGGETPKGGLPARSEESPSSIGNRAKSVVPSAPESPR